MANINEKNALILQRMMSSEFYLSPLKFALWVYSWGQGDLKRFKGPRKWQREVMLEIEEYLKDGLTQKKIFDKFPDYFREAVSSGRGPGKSALVGMLAHWFVSTRIGSSTWVAANGEPQLRTKTFPEIAKWVARGINSEFFDITSTMILPSKWFKEYIESPEGLGRSTRYYYIAGQLWSAENPDAFAGAHNFDGEFAIFDEASSIPENIWTVQEGVFTEDIVDRFWLVFSNPRNNNGAFYDCFHKNKESWRTRQIDSRTVEGINHAPFDSIIKRFGEDSDEAKVEVYGQFPSVGDDQFISPKMVDEAIGRDPVFNKNAELVMGVDPARFGSDRSVIAVRNGSVLVKTYKYQGLDTMQLVGKVIEAIREHRPDLTIVDEGGLGAGVLDRLVEQGYKVRGVAFGSKADNPKAYFNKRSEMWGRLREWLRTASIGSMDENREKDNKELKKDLTAPKYKISSSGSIQLESKADMKKRGVSSPDCFVAGTMITTPKGYVPIETVRVGDFVTTPVGNKKVVYAHAVEADSITTVTFSDGRVLSGKGSHRVFTFDKGWVRLDAIATDNVIESDSCLRRLLWKFRTVLFTRVNHSGFKHQVDTISQGVTDRLLTRNDFFIVESGSSILGRFLRGFTSIIKMAIGQTTESKILIVSMGESTSEIIQEKQWQTLRNQYVSGKVSLKPENGHLLGTLVRKVENGTVNTEKKRGSVENLRLLFVSTVLKSMKHSSKIGRNIAQVIVCNLLRIAGALKIRLQLVKNAETRFPTINTPLGVTVLKHAQLRSRVRYLGKVDKQHLPQNLVNIVENLTKHISQVVLGFVQKSVELLQVIGVTLRTLFVKYVEKLSHITNTRLGNIVPVHVLTSQGQKTKTYNLTLESENVYYANGVLVENCGDSVAISLAFPIGSGVLDSEGVKLWREKDLPGFEKIVQSYHGAFTEKTTNDSVACTVWGVFRYREEQCIMMLDAWSEKMSYTATRSRIVEDWHATYGNKVAGSRQYKTDMALIGAEGAGDSLVLDLRSSGVGVPTYKAGDADLTERAHQISPILDMGVVYVPESSVKKGLPISWARGTLEQMDRFPSDTETGLIDTMTRALLFIRDNQLLEMPFAEPDEEPYEKDYSVGRSGYRENPYTA